MEGTKMKLGAKIATGFGSLLVIMLALGGLAIYNMTMVETASVRMNDEYVAEVDILSHLERRSQRAMYNMRGYSMSTDRKYLELGKQEIAKAKESLSEARALAVKFPELTVLKENAEHCVAKLAEYESLAQKTVEGNDKLAALRKEMDATAATYVNNCGAFLTSQEDKLKAEMEGGSSTSALMERATKIGLVNQIISLGNRIRVGNFKAQATWDPDLLQKTLEHFAEMAKKSGRNSRQSPANRTTLTR
jgi:CHASE3 domain sensor protein